MIAARSKRRGFALLMVIVVSVALMAIAIPFAISMRHQEKGAQGGMDRAQARYASLAGRNHALAGVLRGHETTEEARGATAPFNSPYTDGLDEFQVNWTGAVASLEMQDGSGRLRSSSLQDEQGKVNERTAPPLLLDRIKARVDERTQDLRDYITQWNGRPTAYGAAQTIRGIVPGTAVAGGAALTFYLDDASSYGEGAKVRVTWAGVPQYGLVDAVNPNGNDVTVTGIGEGDSQVGALLELEVRHFVNLNTASALVIASCLEGLGLRNKLTEDTVTKAEADNLAAAIIKKKFLTYEEFVEFLKEQRGLAVITQNDEVAIAINFSNPNAKRLAGTGTMPFTLSSSNYVTVIAQGVQDFPSRAVSALSDLREVVELAPAGMLRWRVKSQYDFERMLRIPQGRFVVTWPACVANREVPSSDRNAAAWVTTKLGRDERAAWKIMNHYDNTIAGVSTSKGAIQQRASKILEITNGNVDIEAGAAELWIKTASTSFTIFDAGTEEWSNRLFFTYGPDLVNGGNSLRFILKDSSLEHTYAECRHAVTLVADRWYHFGAFWKGTKFGHAYMTLDGLPVGNYGVWTEAGGSRHTTLQTALVALATDNTVVAAGAISGFPATGAIQIGSETIEYAAISGSSFTGCVRGARGTAPLVHQIGSGVTICGYTSKLAAGTLTFTNPSVPAITWDRLTVGGGQTVGQIGANTLTWVVTSTPVSPPPVGLPMAASMLTVAPPATGAPDITVEFPPTGWLMVGSGLQGEVMHYTGRTVISFTGLTRGLFGTTDKNHLDGETVQLWGFHVTNNTNYLTPTVLAIDDEWFGPVMKEGTDGWRGFVIQRNGMTVPVPMFRGKQPGVGGNLFGTTNAAHVTASNVYPTFGLADQQAGDGDTVTFVEQNATTREERLIKHVRWVPNLGIGTASPPFHLASLGSFTTKEWVPDNLWVRILKFPSGELMGVPQQLMTFAGSTIPTAPAGFSGLLDEMRLTNGPKNLQFQMSASIDATVTTVPILSVGGMDSEGGAILAGDEIIGYAGFDATSNTLINCTRGYLGTTAAVHELGDRVFNMAFLAIASLTAPVGIADKALPCVPNNFPPEGYVYVGTELIGYTSINGAGYPAFPDGCDFRGAFGTVAATHNQYELIYAFPFRYYDRFTANSDDSQTSWFGASQRATGAKWARITWEEVLPNPLLDIQVRVRLNSEPRWANVPTNRPYVAGKGGGIWLFDAPTGGVLGNTKADGIDVRVDFVWLDNAFANGEWKDCAQFRGLAVEYEQEPVIHYHEEK
ncbi:MAG: hypothetical protein FD180_4098 [Planctomycetota bacterium]|nr:MAG: hypothetical protein FD180_4098 [Planctomycetota bacterium]